MCSARTNDLCVCKSTSYNLDDRYLEIIIIKSGSSPWLGQKCTLLRKSDKTLSEFQLLLHLPPKIHGWHSLDSRIIKTVMQVYHCKSASLRQPHNQLCTCSHQWASTTCHHPCKEMWEYPPPPHFPHTILLLVQWMSLRAPLVLCWSGQNSL